MHVSKAKTLEAVQVFAPDQVNRLGKLKKAEIASEAERLVVGTGWLPLMFRMPETVAETQAIPEGDGCADAEVQEDEHATA